MTITVVSCYYMIKSKHSHRYYQNWIKNFFKTFSGNIVMFTNEETHSLLKEMVDYPDDKIKYIIKDLYETDICEKYDTAFWENQYKIDNPKKHGGRTKECYIIWNSKFNFLKEAIELNPFKSDKFVWNDIGSLRKRKDISNYPNYQKVDSEKLTIVCLNDRFNKEYYQGEIHLSGAIFGGGKEILLELGKLFYQVFDDYLSNGKFIGCDQQMLSTLYYRNKDKFNLVKSSDWFRLYDLWN